MLSLRTIRRGRQSSTLCEDKGGKKTRGEINRENQRGTRKTGRKVKGKCRMMEQKEMYRERKKRKGGGEEAFREYKVIQSVSFFSFLFFWAFSSL